MRAIIEGNDRRAASRAEGKGVIGNIDASSLRTTAPAVSCGVACAAANRFRTNRVEHKLCAIIIQLNL